MFETIDTTKLETITGGGALGDILGGAVSGFKGGGGWKGALKGAAQAGLSKLSGLIGGGGPQAGGGGAE